MRHLAPHVQSIDQSGLSHVRTAHYEHFLAPRVLIIERVVVLLHSLHELIYVPLSQRVYELQAILFLILLDKVVGPLLHILGQVLHEGVILSEL
jgi:hypothetical protein